MKVSCSMFSQILKLIPRIEFERIVGWLRFSRLRPFASRRSRP